ncbi:MAG: class I SAM-dependent methyltransferase [Nanoarchaeota archaeon]
MKTVYENPKIALGYKNSLRKREGYCKFEREYLKKQIKKNTKSRILDLGCGIARHAPLFGRVAEYIGIDISKKMVEIAKNDLRKRKLNVKLLVGDLRNFDSKIKGKFDLVLLMYHTLGCINSKEERINLFNKIRMRLKNEGVLIIHVHNRNNIRNIKFLISSVFSSGAFGTKKIRSGNLSGAKIHFFSKKELEKELKKSNLEILETIPLEYPNEDKIAKGLKKILFTGGYILKVSR